MLAGALSRTEDNVTAVNARALAGESVAFTGIWPLGRFMIQLEPRFDADGSFLGIAWATQPDGSQRAAEVTVFPESMRGTGEGSYAWDRPGDEGGGKMTNGTAASSKMTNGTVANSKMTNGTVSNSKMTNGTVSAQADGSSLTIQYKNGTADGSQTITIPPGPPIP